jgi:putative endonuclease
MGDFGERMAVARLEATGMRVLARNLRTPSGEIDIVAEDGDDIVFIEVRTRRAADGVAFESLDDRKLRRMWQCAMEWCEAADMGPERARIDVVTVEVQADGRLGQVVHTRGMEIPEE